MPDEAGVSVHSTLASLQSLVMLHSPPNSTTATEEKTLMSDSIHDKCNLRQSRRGTFVMVLHVIFKLVGISNTIT